MNDIVATGVNIGSYDEPFMGTFDGNGHKITISFTYPSNDLGLFRYTRGATIKNLTIAGDITFYNNNPNSGNQYVGGVVARGDSTTIINCTNLANITVHGGWGSYFGGIAGELQNSTVAFCSNAGNITVPTDVDYTGVSVGGIVGDLHSNTYLSNCINIGTVKGRWRVGGIAGGFSCDGVGVISDCMNAGWIQGLWDVAGIIGNARDFALMQNCLSVGVIEGMSSFYALAGALLPNQFSNCYYDNQMAPLNGIASSTNPPGIYSLSTAELTKPAIKNALGSAWIIYPNPTHLSYIIHHIVRFIAIQCWKI